MPKSKHEPDSTPPSSSSSTLTLHTLQPDTAGETAKYLPLKDIAMLARTSISNNKLFQPILCEAGRPFYPLPDFKSAPFKRGFNIYNDFTGLNESLMAGAVLSPGLGSDFAVIKAGRAGAAGWSEKRPGDVRRAGQETDLIAPHRLIEDAKANVVEFKPGLGLNAHNPESNRHLGPG